MAKLLKVKAKEKLELSADEAIENLMTIADMDINEKTPIGILQNSKITTREEDFSYKGVEWLFPEDATGFFERIKPSFRAIVKYLKGIYENPATDWEDEMTKNGIQSIMALVADAGCKLRSYFALFRKDIDISKTEEFKELQDFYLNHICKKFPENLEGKDEWVHQWIKNKEKEALDFDKSGAKDFDAVGEDIDYELFYIKDMEEPLFSPELIRNVKLFTYFDDTVKEGDDLLFRIKMIKNKDMQFTSKQILRLIDEDLHNFYRYKFDWKNNKLARCLNKSFIALMLASNPKIFFKSDVSKSCFEYFNDFKVFLRDSFSSDEYQKALSYENENKDKKSRFLVRLLHELCFAFFFRVGGIRKEVIGYLYRIIRKGKDKEKLQKEASFWNILIEKDDSMRLFFKKNPNGPMAKLFEALERGEAEFGFDPIRQGVIPEKLYQIQSKRKKIDVMYIPCPTKQKIITNVEIAEEFLGLLRHFVDAKIKHFLFNFQNRYSWRENARATALEDIQKKAEFKSVITVISLSKDSNFYNQTEDFFSKTSVEDFIKTLKYKFFSKEEEYFLPLRLKTDKLNHFVNEACLKIHKVFFMDKKDLSRQERCDFIEIFYHFLILKIIEEENFSSLSFVCKDGIDTSSAMNGSLWGFIKIIEGGNWTKEDEDFLLWLIYAPALLLRGRAIISERLIRQISCLALIDANKKGLKKVLKDLYDPAFIDSIKINYIH